MQQFCYEGAAPRSRWMSISHVHSALPRWGQFPALQQAPSCKFWNGSLALSIYGQTGFLLPRCHFQYSSFRIPGLLCSGGLPSKIQGFSNNSILCIFKTKFLPHFPSQIIALSLPFSLLSQIPFSVDKTFLLSSITHRNKDCFRVKPRGPFVPAAPLSANTPLSHLPFRGKHSRTPDPVLWCGKRRKEH